MNLKGEALKEYKFKAVLALAFTCVGAVSMGMGADVSIQMGWDALDVFRIATVLLVMGDIFTMAALEVRISQLEEEHNGDQTE